MIGDKELFERMDNRGTGGNLLPAKVIHYIPEEDAPRVLELDKRLKKLQKLLPLLMMGTIILISFTCGRVVG